MADETKAAPAATQAQDQGARCPETNTRPRTANAVRRRASSDIDSVVARVQRGSLRYRDPKETREFIERRREAALRRQKEKEQEIPETIVAQEPSLVPSRLRHMRNFYSRAFAFSNNRILTSALSNFNQLDDAYRLIFAELPAVISDRKIVSAAAALANTRFAELSARVQELREKSIALYKQNAISMKAAGDPDSKLQMDTPPREFVFKFSEPGTPRFLAELEKADTAICAEHYLVMMGLYPEEEEIHDQNALLSAVRNYTSVIFQLVRRFRTRIRNERAAAQQAPAREEPPQGGAAAQEGAPAQEQAAPEPTRDASSAQAAEQDAGAPDVNK